MQKLKQAKENNVDIMKTVISQSDLTKVESGLDKKQNLSLSDPYSAFSSRRRTFVLLLVTVAGFFGPLSGGIYLPALNVLAKDFHVSNTLINVTVAVFMLVFAIGVSVTILQTGV